MKKITRNLFVSSLLSASLITFTSCLSVKKTMLLQDKAAAVNNFENKKKTNYIIQTGDHLYIKVYSLDPKTSKFFQTDMPSLMNPTYLYLNSYLVDEQGYIDFSFADKMFVKGMTIDDVKKKLQNTLNEYFKESTVVVKLVDFQVSVLGEVNSPGNFTIDKDQLNVLQALSRAGGPKDFANIRKVMLIRQTINGSEVSYLDLSDKKILASDNFYLMPNDILYLEPLKGKNYLVTQVPYTAVLSVLSLAATMLVLFKVVK